MYVGYITVYQKSSEVSFVKNNAPAYFGIFNCEFPVVAKATYLSNAPNSMYMYAWGSVTELAENEEGGITITSTVTDWIGVGIQRGNRGSYDLSDLKMEH